MPCCRAWAWPLCRATWWRPNWPAARLSACRCRRAAWTFCPRASTCCTCRRSEEHTSELQSLAYLVCRLLLAQKNTSELQSLAYLVCRLLLEKKHRLTPLCDQ